MKNRAFALGLAWAARLILPSAMLKHVRSYSMTCPAQLC